MNRHLAHRFKRLRNQTTNCGPFWRSFRQVRHQPHCAFVGQIGTGVIFAAGLPKSRNFDRDCSTRATDLRSAKLAFFARHRPSHVAELFVQATQVTVDAQIDNRRFGLHFSSSSAARADRRGVGR